MYYIKSINREGFGYFHEKYGLVDMEYCMIKFLYYNRANRGSGRHFTVTSLYQYFPAVFDPSC